MNYFTGQDLNDSDLYRYIVETAEEGIWVIDATKNTVYINNKMAELLGYTVDEMRGKSLFDFMDEDLKADAEDDLKRCQQGILERRDFKFRRKDGTDLWAIVVTNPITDSAGTYIGGIGLLTDITERKRTEEALHEAKARVEALSEVLASINNIMRHDLINNLSTLQAGLTLYQEKGDGKYLKKAGEMVTKSVTLLKRMKDLEYLTMKRRSLKPVAARAIAEMVIADNTTDNVAFTLKGKGMVLADLALHSVLDNLVRNALIHAEPATVAITIENQQDCCEIRVADDGKGIPDCMKPRVFEPGFKNGEKAGTGLGLYIVKKTIERYGGEVKVEDNEPRGSTFVVKLKNASPRGKGKTPL